MKIRLTHLACAVFLSWSAQSFPQVLPNNKDVVPDELTAIEVAKPILKAYLGEKKFDKIMRGEKLLAELEDGVWTVYPYPDEGQHGGAQKDSDGTPYIVVVTGGRSPVIEISKSDGCVLSISIAR